MPSDPKIRCGDADRERTAALLSEHHAAGRLTAEEFHERLEKAYAAKTQGELDELLADLPAIDLYALPDATLRRGRPGYSQLPWWPAPGKGRDH
jgi:hypothetical protein